MLNKKQIKLSNKIRTAVFITFAVIMPLVSSCNKKVEKRKVSETYIFEEKEPSIYTSLEEAKQDLNEERKMLGITPDSLEN